MDMYDIVQGGGLVIGGAALAKIIDVAARWLSARNQRTTISPQPLEVAPAPKYRTCEECERIHRAVDRRLDAIEAIGSKLDALDVRNEERMRRVHSRLDDIVTEVAASKRLIENHLEDHRSMHNG